MRLLEEGAKGKEYAIHWFLEHGADVNAVNWQGNTALHHHLLHHHHHHHQPDPSGLGVVELLLDGGADVHAPNAEGLSFLDLVAGMPPSPYRGWVRRLLLLHQGVGRGGLRS